MNDQNSSIDSLVRPEDLMAELDLKKSTYYDDLKYLDITASKDENKKAYLTIDQANAVRALRSYVIENGKRYGLTYGGLAVSSNNELATNPDPDSIYVEVEEPTSNVDLDALFRGAAQLKARELATPNLLIRGLANRMSKEDLPEDLKEKVAIAREVANPKVDTRRVSGQTISSTPQPQRACPHVSTGTSTSGRVSFRDSDSFNNVVKAVAAGNSVLVLGEAGTGKGNFALALHEEMSGEYCSAIGEASARRGASPLGRSAIATYKGSIKKFYQAMPSARRSLIAMQLDIPTTETQYNKNGDPIGEKDLTVDAIKQEILDNCGEDTLLIFPEAKRLTTSIRYWIEDMMSAGARVVCFAVANPGRDIYLDMLEIELELPSDAHIRLVMAAEAQRQGLEISKSKLAELQPLAGRNPMLARKIIRNEKLGLKQDKPEHTQYVVIMPVIIAMLFSFAVVRFIGMGTGNKGLYITGGVCLVSAMALKQLGNVRGARKRLGQ